MNTRADVDALIAPLAPQAERSSQAVVITDADNRIRWANPAFAEFAGKALADCLGRRPATVLPFLRKDRAARAPLARALAARQPARVRTRRTPAQGSAQWIEIDLQPLLDDAGQYQGCIAFVTDISQLVAETEQSQALLQSLPVGVVVMDANLCVLQGNAGVARIFGTELETLVGARLSRHYTDVVDEDGQPLQQGRCPLRLTLQDGQPRHDLVYGLRRTDGQRRWLRVSAVAQRDAQDHVTRVIACFIDQTEEREQERMLNLAIEAARIAPWSWNLTDDVAQFERRAARGFGLRTDGETTGLQQLKLWPVIHREDAMRLRALLEEHRYSSLPSLRAELRLPAADGSWRWVLVAGATSERDATGKVTALSGVMIDIDERKRAEAALQTAATTDQLTGLPNRSLLGERLQEALYAARQHAHGGALLFVDLDHFKRINDVYGHLVGDKVLRAAGQRLQRLLRADDTLARMGGDELMLLLPRIEGDMQAAAQAAEIVGAKLLQALARPFEIEGAEFALGASIGCTLFPKDGQETAEDLIREADTAMYAAKAAGRGMLRRYESDMQRGVAERLALERDLRQAVRQQSFAYMLQGKWRLVPNEQGDLQAQLAGAELLLRWQHPERGTVSPAVFIPVAEESALILAIGRWVIDQACALLARWQAQGQLVPLAINVSPRQFREPGFADELLASVRHHGIPPACLTLEITEGVLMEEDVASRLQQLAAQGFRFSIDDFGTGYSSLMYLKKLPVHELKIDRAFVRDLTCDPEDAAIVSAMLAIARSFRLDVVAEGVETPQQAAWLQAHGCTMMQGYLLGKPMEPARFDAQRLPQAAGGAVPVP